jgi:hypothetical protein
MRGRSRTDWWGVVLEAPDAQALADFCLYLDQDEAEAEAE